MELKIIGGDQASGKRFERSHVDFVVVDVGTGGGTDEGGSAWRSLEAVYSCIREVSYLTERGRQ